MATSIASGRSVTIRLVGPDGRPAAGQWLTLLDATGVTVGRLQADKDGTVSMSPKDGSVAFRVGQGLSSPYLIDVQGRAGEVIEVPLTKESRQTIRMYGQLVDRTGQPAAGVGLVVMRTGDKAALATSASDSNGAFLLTFMAPDTTGEQYVLQVSVNEDPIPLSELEAIQGGLYGPHNFVVEHRPPSTLQCVAPRPVLIGSEEETLAAFKRSPQLFMRPLPARSPDPCSPYTPGEVATRVYQLNQLVMFPWMSAVTAPETAGASSGAVDFINMSSSLPKGQPLRYGALIEFRQEWWDLGFTLGNLLYSVPLAPCEETKVATVDWRRKDYAKRQSALDESFFQDTTVSRDEAINEAVRMASDKTVTDTTEGGGGSISLGFISGGYAKTVETITDVADVTTTASRYINDRIQQVGNTLRNTRAFSIVEATQEEESVVRTRVLRNHNHCHTVTFQYYEVLRNFLISTFVQKLRPVVFVPATLPSFDQDLARRFAYVLRRALLDPTLQGPLDNLLGIPEPAATGATQTSSSPGTTTSGAGGTTTGAPGSEPTIKRFHVRGQLDATSNQGWWLGSFLLIETRSQGSHKLSMLPDITGDGYADEWVADPTFVIGGQSQPWTIHPSDIERLGVLNGSPVPTNSTGDVSLTDFLISADLSDQSTAELWFQPSLTLPNQKRVVTTIAQSGGSSSAGSGTSAGGPTSSSGGTSPAPDLTRLLDHLNANVTHYASAIITAGDAGLRWLVLSTLTDDNSIALADIVENRVAGCVGNYMAFPLSAPDHLPSQYGQIDGSWLATPPEESMVSLPTPGVFAESQLGSCSACETIDQAKFWDWQRSPCPEDAPNIDSAMLASRYQDLKDMLDFVKGTLTPPPVQIPQEPKPMITIGDATLEKMLDIGQFNGSQDLLDFIGKLAQIAAQGVKDIVNAGGNPGANQGGLGANPGDGTGAAAGGVADPSTAAEGGGLEATAATAAAAAAV